VRVIIDASPDSTMPFRSKPKPFLDAARRDWQFETCAWLLRNCGGYAKFHDTTLVLPTEEHFPDRGMKGHAAVAALFRRARDHAGMADWPCTVEREPDEPHETANAPDGIRVFTYRRGPLEPQKLVAGFACDLSRFLIDTFDEPPPGGEAAREAAIELGAVFMGFGVFLCNASVRQASFRLSEGELAHALAVFCRLRELSLDTLDAHLSPHLRKYLRLASLELAQHEPEFRKLRGIQSAVPVARAAHQAV
jgi:hypothetical protein